MYKKYLVINVRNKKNKLKSKSCIIILKNDQHFILILEKHL